MKYWDNWDFKPDADRIKAPYTGDFDSYLESLFVENDEESRDAFAKSEYSVTMNFVKFCEGVARVKQREYRESKIDSIIS
jgi:hypothetical protein